MLRRALIEIFWILFVSFFCLILTLLFQFAVGKGLEKNKEKTEINQTKATTKDNTLNLKEEFLLFMDSINIKYPQIVLAQAILESNNFSSNVFKTHNNIFGMKIPAKRPSFRTLNTNTTYSSYKSWKHSVIDYGFYQSSFIYKIKNEEEYLKYLAKNYCTDKNYIRKLQELIKSNTK